MQTRQRVWPVLAICLAVVACQADPRSPLSPPDDAPQRADSPDRPAESSPVRQAAPRAGDWFDDITSSSGVRFSCHNGREAERFLLIESLGGGVAIGDFDLDGDADLLFTGGGTISRDDPLRIAGLPAAMFRNSGAAQFDDVSGPAGLAGETDYSQGCAVGDFDADGFPDLFICCYGRSRLYRNQGDGTFSGPPDGDQAPELGWATAAAFGDADGDGLADLLVARYADWSPDGDRECEGLTGERDLCGPREYAGTTCLFLHNAGDGRFVDWSDRVGIQGKVHGLGVVAADFNDDGRIDFYVASDETANQLYLSHEQGNLIETALAAGVALGEWGQPEGSMGIDAGDYDGDGQMDLVVTNFETEAHALYRGLGAGLYLHSTTAAGLGGASRLRVGFGVSLADFDGDGWLDLFLLNGNTQYRGGQSPFRQLPQLYRNEAGRRFLDVTNVGGPFFREPHAGRGNAAGDLDNDGALDLATSQVNDPVRVLKNLRTPANFASVRLRAVLGEPDATGARVSVEHAGRVVTRFAVRGAGYFSQSDPRILLPVEPRPSHVDLLVEWPGRAREAFRVSTRRTHTLVEGRGAAVDD